MVVFLFNAFNVSLHFLSDQIIGSNQYKRGNRKPPPTNLAGPCLICKRHGYKGKGNWQLQTLASKSSHLFSCRDDKIEAKRTRLNNFCCQPDLGTWPKHGVQEEGNEDSIEPRRFIKACSEKKTGTWQCFLLPKGVPSWWGVETLEREKERQRGWGRTRTC